jgi:hypothetical protein
MGKRELIGKTKVTVFVSMHRYLTHWEGALLNQAEPMCAVTSDVYRNSPLGGTHIGVRVCPMAHIAAALNTWGLII